MIIFFVYNLKGGVGKTTSCINLSYLSALDGLKTLVWDLDPQGACSFYLNKKTGHKKQVDHNDQILKTKLINKNIRKTDFPNLDLLPSDEQYRHLASTFSNMKDPDEKLKKLLSNLEETYQVLFIDGPPTLSELADTVFSGVKYILMPMIPSPLSERAYLHVEDYLERKKFKHIKVLPFFNLVDLRRSLHKEILEKYSDNKLKSFIKQSSVVEKMGIHQAPLNNFDKGPIANSYEDLWEEVKELPQLKRSFKKQLTIKPKDGNKWLRKIANK